MPDSFTIVLLSVLVVFLSTLSTIAGLGGGIFLIPLIVIFFNLPLKYVAGTILLAMVPFTAVATISNVRNGYVYFRTGLIVQIGAIIGVLIGARYSAVLPNAILKGLFVAVAFYLLISLYVSNRSGFNLAAQLFYRLKVLPPLIERDKTTGEKMSLTALIVIGSISGAMSGLLGIGGGFMFVPLFIAGMRLPIKIAVGTSLFMILLTSSAGAIQHAFLGHIRYDLAFLLAIGMMGGATIGTRVLKKVREPFLMKMILVILLFAVIGIMIR